MYALRIRDSSVAKQLPAESEGGKVAGVHRYLWGVEHVKPVKTSEVRVQKSTTLRRDGYHQPQTLLAYFLLLLWSSVVGYIIGRTIYNLYFHPLRKFPGLWINKISILPYLWFQFKGKDAVDLLKPHTKYGHVARYGPNELSFSSAQAWKDIYSFRPGHKTFPKSTWYDSLSISAAQGIGSIINERNPTKHAAMSRLYGGAFSRGSLNEMEPMITDYIDRFIGLVGSKTANGGIVDLTFGYTSMTFDIIGDLAFGQNFGAMGMETPHKFVCEFVESLACISLHDAIKRFPALGPIARVLFRGKVAKLRPCAP